MELEKCPASKIRQLAERMGSSKTTAHHTKQVAGDPQAAKSISCRTSAQNFHQEDTRRENHLSSKDHLVTGMLVLYINKCQVTTRRNLIQRMSIKTKRDVQSVEILLTWKVFSALLRNFNVKLVTSLDPSQVFDTRRNKFHSSPRNQKLTNCKQEHCMDVRMPYVATLKRVPVMIHFTCC